MNPNTTDIGAHFLPAPTNGGFAMEGYWVWCGSVVQGTDGSYHMFASRWPKSLPFHPGWGIASEIVRAVSKTPQGPYQFAEVVLPARGAQFWDGRATHNPLIQKCGDTYLLFYVGTTYPYAEPSGTTLTHDSYQWQAARANKRIGIATAKSPLGPWQRPDAPSFGTNPHGFDNFLVSNPAPCVQPDGSCLLVYKARSYQALPYTSDGTVFGDMTLGVAFAPHFSQPFRRLSQQPLFCGKGILEDPFLWKTSTGYAMIAKDWNGFYTGDVGSAVAATSPDGVQWAVQKKPAFSRSVLWADGTRRTMGNMDRPFLLFDQNGNATHLFAATSDGADASFGQLTRTWNLCIPLAQ